MKNKTDSNSRSIQFTVGAVDDYNPNYDGPPGTQLHIVMSSKDALELARDLLNKVIGGEITRDDTVHITLHGVRGVPFSSESD